MLFLTSLHLPGNFFFRFLSFTFLVILYFLFLFFLIFSVVPRVHVVKENAQIMTETRI